MDLNIGRQIQANLTSYIKTTNTSQAQQTLEHSLSQILYLMGVGCGDTFNKSGEHYIFDLIKQKTNAPYTIFDVGANRGMYLKLIKTYLNTSIVHCFEPSKATFKILSDNSVKYTNVVLNNFGIGKTKTSVPLYTNKSGSELASIYKRRLDHFNIPFNGSETIELDTIDNYCEANAISHIHLLKMDIEGNEFDALNGAVEMFKKNAVDFTTFEFGGCNIDSKIFFQDFYYFFKNHNKTIHRITPSGYLFPVVQYKELYEQFGTSNYVAF